MQVKLDWGRLPEGEAIPPTDIKKGPAMTLDLRKALDWPIPPGAERIRTIDAHTAGEPLRIVIDGTPALEGSTVLEKRSWARERADRYRTALMWEPRGHADMYGCWIGPPERDDSDFSIVFMHNAGYSTMCGHGIIAAATVVAETGMRAARGEPAGEPSGTPAGESLALRIDSPAGLIRAEAVYGPDERVVTARFRNVASFVADRGCSVNVDPYERVEYDLAFGGAYYAFVDAASVGLSCTPDRTDDLIRAGRRIKEAIRSSHPIIPATRAMPILDSCTASSLPGRRSIRHTTAGTSACSPTAKWIAARPAPASQRERRFWTTPEKCRSERASASRASSDRPSTSASQGARVWPARPPSFRWSKDGPSSPAGPSSYWTPGIRTPTDSF